MIKSIFYSRFHPEKGSTVLHQVPAGSISLTNTAQTTSKKLTDSQTLTRPRRSSSSPNFPRQPHIHSDNTAADTTIPEKREALFSFSAVSDYLIPRPEYRNTCISVCVNSYRIIGYPVCIYGKQYPRNEFIFNVAIVVDIDAEVVVWTGVVRRIVALLQEMEKTAEFLSEDELEAVSDMPISTNDTTISSGRGKVYALCEMILEDLNNYSECMIPLDPANTLNLKLFPVYPPPPTVANYHVPLLTVDLSSFADPTWDLTMQMVTPYIDGVNSVARIADIIEADSRLVRQAIEHLVYYGCCLLLDVFSFAASYAVTPAFGTFVADQDMQDECARYVSVAVAVAVERRRTDANATSPSKQLVDSADIGESETPQKEVELSEVKRHDVIRLYASLRQGVPLRTWCLDNKAALLGIDVRRLVTFGVIRGFLYRIHKYAIATNTTGATTHQDQLKKSIATHDYSDQKTTRRTNTNKSAVMGNNADDNLEEHLSRYLDGLHCFDEICTALHVPDKSIISVLKSRRDVQIIQR